MKRLAPIVGLALLAAACAGDSVTTTTFTATTTITTEESTSTTFPAATTTTAEPTTPSFPNVELPTDAPCALDEVPDGGEAAVIVDGRLYGLGADGISARCLADNVDQDIQFGPQGDRLRTGNTVLTDSRMINLPSASSFDWTAPTGSRVLAVSSDRLWKVSTDDLTETDITFLTETESAAYHPAGEHLLAIGTNSDGQYGLWLATNQGEEPLLLAFDELAAMSDPAWTWLGEPLFIAKHTGGPWHIHRVELNSEGALDGPIIVELDESIDMLTPARYDAILLAFRTGGTSGSHCVEGSHVKVNGVDLPEPIASLTSTPIGWLSTERLLLMTYPNGCDAPGDLWSFSAGFCPGSVYGAFPVISGIDGAAAREAAPPPPPPPDFTGIIDPGPA